MRGLPSNCYYLFYCLFYYFVLLFYCFIVYLFIYLFLPSFLPSFLSFFFLFSSLFLFFSFSFFPFFNFPRSFPFPLFLFFFQIFSSSFLLLVLTFHHTCSQQTPLKPHISRELLISVLKEAGGGPLGAFNEKYMAFSREGTIRFTDLAVEGQENGAEDTPENFESLTGFRSDEASSPIKPALMKIARYPQTTIRGSCDTKLNGFPRMCSACPATTDLGPGRIPRYINEVLCNSKKPNKMCNRGNGWCNTVKIHQQFLRVTNYPTTSKLGHVFVEPYTQQIRTSCECLLFVG